MWPLSVDAKVFLNCLYVLYKVLNLFPLPGQPPACLLPLQTSFHFLKFYSQNHLVGTHFFGLAFISIVETLSVPLCVSTGLSFSSLSGIPFCADDAPYRLGRWCHLGCFQCGAPWCLPLQAPALPFLGGTCPGVEWLDHVVGVAQTVFQSGSFRIYLLQYASAPVLPHPHR